MTILAQMEDQHPFAMVCNQELTFHSFQQETLSNPSQWCERFNTNVDVGSAVGMTCQHKVLLEHAARELHTRAFDALAVSFATSCLMSSTCGLSVCFMTKVLCNCCNAKNVPQLVFWFDLDGLSYVTVSDTSACSIGAGRIE